MEVNCKLKVGMIFYNLDMAWNFWIVYGGKIGFVVRKQYINPSKKDVKFKCWLDLCAPNKVFGSTTKEMVKLKILD